MTRRKGRLTVYYLLLATIIINGLVFGKKRKWFVFSSFFLLVLVAAMRSTNVGIDLAGHYARYYQLIVKSDWGTIGDLALYTGYDPGYIVLCKILGFISADPHCYIIATSIFIYFSVAVYIYRYSDDVVLETFLFMTSFMYFMYMNIIAQGIAVAIIMLAVKYLNEKKYIQYCVFVIIATSIHSSAIFALIFIPLSLLQVKRKYITEFVVGAIIVLLTFDKLLSILATTIFSQFAHYFQNGNVHGMGQKLDIYTFCLLMIYVLSVMCAWLFLYNSSGIVLEPVRELKIKKNRFVYLLQTNSNFLVYMTISAILFRLLATKAYIVSRMGYYTYFFGLTLLVRSVNAVRGRQRFIVKIMIYVLFAIFFLKFGSSAGKLSYGVVPYELFK